MAAQNVARFLSKTTVHLLRGSILNHYSPKIIKDRFYIQHFFFNEQNRKKATRVLNHFNVIYVRCVIEINSIDPMRVKIKDHKHEISTIVFNNKIALLHNVANIPFFSWSKKRTIRFQFSPMTNSN